MSLTHLECEGVDPILENLSETEGKHEQHDQLAVHAGQHRPQVHAAQVHVVSTCYSLEVNVNLYSSIK